MKNYFKATRDNIDIAIKYLNEDQAQEIEKRGFFIGLPTKILNKKIIKHLSNLLLHITKI